VVGAPLVVLESAGLLGALRTPVGGHLAAVAWTVRLPHPCSACRQAFAAAARLRAQRTDEDELDGGRERAREAGGFVVAARVGEGKRVVGVPAVAARRRLVNDVSATMTGGAR
jgi:hypothetical protein